MRLSVVFINNNQDLTVILQDQYSVVDSMLIIYFLSALSKLVHLMVHKAIQDHRTQQ